jgi:hypothetical protein
VYTTNDSWANPMKQPIEAGGKVLIALGGRRDLRTRSQIAEPDNELSTARLKAFKETPSKDGEAGLCRRRGERARSRCGELQASAPRVSRDTVEHALIREQRGDSNAHSLRQDCRH